MNSHAPTPADLTFTDADFQVISRFAALHYGLDIKIEKKGLIYARLARRIRSLGLADFKSYCDFATRSSSVDEQVELLSALTTNVSSFYREKHHFDILRSTVLPALRTKAESADGVRIWSAGCSAGQEPYSIAATVKEVWPDHANLNVSILATDVDPRIVEKARAAIYRTSELVGLSAPQHQGLFDTVQGKAETFAVRRDLRNMVTFDELNLIGPWHHAKAFDIIFCRNVVIYFERSTQHRLWQRFDETLAPAGHLFIGHSERLNGPAETRFRNIGITAFAKTTP